MPQISPQRGGPHLDRKKRSNTRRQLWRAANECESPSRRTAKKDADEESQVWIGRQAANSYTKGIPVWHDQMTDQF